MPYTGGHGLIGGTDNPLRPAFSTLGFGPEALTYSTLPPGLTMTSPAHSGSPWFQVPPMPVINISPTVPYMATDASSMDECDGMSTYVQVPHVPVINLPSTILYVSPDASPMEERDWASPYATYTTTPVSPTGSLTWTSYPMPATPVCKPSLVQTPPYTPETDGLQATPNILTDTSEQFPLLPSHLAQLEHPGSRVGLGISIAVDHPACYTETVGQLVDLGL